MFLLGTAGQIRISRGDSAIFEYTINQGTNFDPIKYELKEGDELFFGVMEPNQPFEQAIIKKRYTYLDQLDGCLYIEFKPTDTLCLLPGLYYYQIKIRIRNPENGSMIVNTLIPKTQFWIEE